MIRIESPQELAAFQAAAGLRTDWHEPDDQGVTARVIGEVFDNAGGPVAREHDGGELYVVLRRTTLVDGAEVSTEVAVNLADLCAWATRGVEPAAKAPDKPVPGALTKAQMFAIGGRPWCRGDQDRVYLNVDTWAPMINLVLSWYKSGNVQSATLNGEKISNRRGSELAAGKVFWENGAIHVQGALRSYEGRIIRGIRRLVDAAGER